MASGMYPWWDDVETMRAEIRIATAHASEGEMKNENVASAMEEAGFTDELLDHYCTWHSVLASFHGDFSHEFLMSEFDMRDGIGGAVASLQVIHALVTDPTFRGVHLFLLKRFKTVMGWPSGQILPTSGADEISIDNPVDVNASGSDVASSKVSSTSTTNASSSAVLASASGTINDKTVNSGAGAGMSTGSATITSNSGTLFKTTKAREQAVTL